MSHPNAPLTVHGRLILVGRIESSWPVSAAARAAGVSRQTARQMVPALSGVRRGRTRRRKLSPRTGSHRPCPPGAAAAS